MTDPLFLPITDGSYPTAVITAFTTTYPLSLEHDLGLAQVTFPYIHKPNGDWRDFQITLHRRSYGILHVNPSYSHSKLEIQTVQPRALSSLLLFLQDVIASFETDDRLLSPLGKCAYRSLGNMAK
jgi:hypothetical protein